MDKTKNTTLKTAGILLLTTVVLVLLNAEGVTDKRILPFGDAGGYYQHALTLYGKAHSGQLSQAMSVLARPSKNLFPSTLLFLLLPEQSANSAGYGFVNNLGWHLLTIAGIWIFLYTFNKTRFTIPAFLLVCANNYAMDPTYYYYMDLPFMAVTLVALALSVLALKNPATRNIILCGAAAAAAFLAKPPNALINTGLLVCFIGGVLLTRLAADKNKEAWQSLLRFCLLWAAGFLPLFILSLLCGALESIVDVIYLNEAGNIFYSELTSTGLLRAFYFPLCLSFYYSLPLVMLLLTVLFAFRFIPKLNATNHSTPGIEKGDHLILGWMLGVFILFWGLYFSFALSNKLIRSLALMLPILWTSLFVVTPLRSLRTWAALPVCIVFFALPFAQSKWGFLKEKQNRNPETYTLSGDWPNRWPAKRPDLAQGTATTEQLQQLLNQSGVRGGKIGVGTEMINWNAHALKSWCNQDSLRKGNPPAYDFKYICPGRFTTPLRSTMENADALLLILEPRVQYSQNLYKINVELTNYAMRNWNGTHAKVNVVYNHMKQPSVCVVAFKTPLQGNVLDQLETALYKDGFSEKGNAASSFKDLPLNEKIIYLRDQLTTAPSAQQ